MVAVVIAQTSHQKVEVGQKGRSTVVVGFVVGSDQNQRTDLIVAVLFVVEVVQREMLYPY